MQRKVKHQVFISSTYKDLQEERWAVLRSLLSMDCIVSGMELFPAIDMEQFAYIKQIIDDCDYYVLILGGRYGSESPEGLSYTEMEYDYACSKGIPVIALVYDKPDELPTDKRETDPDALRKFRTFYTKAANARLVRFWSDIKDLQIFVIQALHHAEKNFPSVGWVRGSVVANEEVLLDLNYLRKENDDLKEENRNLKERISPIISDLQPIESTITLPYYLFLEPNKTYEVTVRWKDIFIATYNYLRDGCDRENFSNKVIDYIKAASTHKNEASIRFRHPIMNTIVNQLTALNLITHQIVSLPPKEIITIYSLTKYGLQYGLAELAQKNTNKND